MNGAAGALNSIIVDAKADVFCVELAMQSLSIAYEAYYDPPDCITESGSGPMAILETMGFAYVAFVYDEESEIYGLVTRHIETRKLVFSFRGTRNSRHWKTNLDYGQLDFDLENLPLPSDLDECDGLGVEEVTANNSIGETKVRQGRGDAVMSPLNEESEDSHEMSESQLHQNDSHDIDDHSYAESFYSAKGEDIRRNSESFFSTYEDEEEWDDLDSIDDIVPSRPSDTLPLYDKGIRETILMPVKATINAVGTVKDIATTAAKKTPILSNLVKEKVHKGFFEAYLGIRTRIHEIIRRELKKSHHKLSLRAILLEELWLLLLL